MRDDEWSGTFEGDVFCLLSYETLCDASCGQRFVDMVARFFFMNRAKGDDEERWRVFTHKQLPFCSHVFTAAMY
jgi:hypothetical protein